MIVDTVQSLHFQVRLGLMSVQQTKLNARAHFLGI